MAQNSKWHVVLDPLCFIRMNDEHSIAWWVAWFGDLIFYFGADIISFLLSSLLEIFSGL